jgi:hypothetical protein
MAQSENKVTRQGIIIVNAAGEPRSFAKSDHHPFQEASLNQITSSLSIGFCLMRQPYGSPIVCFSSVRPFFYLRPNVPLKAKPFCYARRRSSRTSARGRTRRKIAEQSGGRVCARRNGTHSRGRTWRPFARASDCYRPLEGAAGGSRLAGSQARQNRNQTSGPS